MRSHPRGIEGDIRQRPHLTRHLQRRLYPVLSEAGLGKLHPAHQAAAAPGPHHPRILLRTAGSARQSMVDQWVVDESAPRCSRLARRPVAALDRVAGAERVDQATGWLHGLYDLRQ